MSTYKIPNELILIDRLYQAKEQELKESAGYLGVTDVKEDRNFQSTVDRIKKEILLTPVAFGEPKISDHRPETRNMPPNYQNLMGGSKEVFVITVDFPFTGSPELFEVLPNGVMFSSGRIYQPDYNSVSVEVTLPVIDKQAAISEALGLMEATFSMVKANNEQAESWSKTKEVMIDSLLAQKRKGIIDLYS